MPLEKALIKNEKTQEEIEVLFNPNEYNLESGNQFAWEKMPGLSSPIAQFISGEAETLTMDLFFDSYEEKEDVRVKYTSKITNLLKVNKDLHAPPVCSFIWGSLEFKGIVERVSQRFTMFLDSGKPVRATLNVTFKGQQSIREQFQEIPRQSSDRTKQRMLRQGEHLWMIAAEEYENPGLWREIARANGIDNPRLLETGKFLTVPPLE